jgi:hypothetical protein
MALIRDHAFRGLTFCLFPDCGKREPVHADSVDARLPQVPHWFIGGRTCLGCGIPFNHPSHCLSPSWIRVMARR